MTWKQPIPTNIEEDFGDDSIVFMLYLLLIYKACNKDTTVNFSGKYVPIKRGQTIFGRNKWSKYFGISPKGIEKILKRLEKVPCKVACERTKNCTIVTILNYDEIVAMDPVKYPASAKRVPSEYPASATSKNDKSVKSDKNNIYTLAFEEFYNLYPRKVGKFSAHKSFFKICKELEAKNKPVTIIVEGLKKQLPFFAKKERQYIPHPATWLNQHRWEDETVSDTRPVMRREIFKATEKPKVDPQKVPSFWEIIAKKQNK